MKLSIIVPVYNSKEYLHQCVKSIINQTYSDIEVILVNDGSTDGSDKICDLYQDIDERVHVIHQENRGCVSARKCGLQKSKGEYIGFVDSDDWIDPDMYKALMSVAEEQECDIVSMGYKSVHGKDIKKEYDATLFGIYEKGKNLDVLLSKMMYDPEKIKRGVHPSLCTKVIKRKYLISVYDHIDENITIGEDAAIFYPCCLRVNSICVLKEYKYYYRIHDESMCTTMNIKTIGEIYSFYEYMKRNLISYENKYDLLAQLKKYIWTFINPGLNQIFNFQVRMTYIFPYTLIEKNTDIILYGAGKVGQAYFYQLSENHYCNIVAWADKDKKIGNNIIEPDKIIGFNYSKIVIAIKNKQVVDEIMEELSDLGISKEIMIWGKPQEIPPVFWVD